jgi:Tfp pilus assembly protein, pilus retraction ATPase PilT
MALPIARAAAMAETLYSIDDLLEQMVARNASDLHVAVGAHPVVRVRGKLEPLQEIPPLTGT